MLAERFKQLREDMPPLEGRGHYSDEQFEWLAKAQSLVAEWSAEEAVEFNKIVDALLSRTDRRTHYAKLLVVINRAMNANHSSSTSSTMTTRDQIQKGYAFIAMPINPSDAQLDDVLDTIKASANRCGIRAERVDEPQSNERITDRILESIRKAEYVIVDLTNSRPNVFYEAAQVTLFLFNAGFERRRFEHDVDASDRGHEDEKDHHDFDKRVTTAFIS